MIVKSEYKRDRKWERNKKTTEKGCWDNSCMCVYVCMWQMVGDIGGSIGFRWFWVAESAKVSCQLPLCTQESGWHCDRSSGKQALSHMLCLTLGSRSNLPRVGRSQISKGRKEKPWTWTKRISSQYFRGYLRSGPKMSIVYLSCCFPAGILCSLTFQKPQESRNVSQSPFLKYYEAHVLCKHVSSMRLLSWYQIWAKWQIKKPSWHTSSECIKISLSLI